MIEGYIIHLVDKCTTSTRLFDLHINNIALQRYIRKLVQMNVRKMNDAGAVDDLFVDRQYIVHQITKESKGFFYIDIEDCQPILPVALDKLTDAERILLEISTSYLCSYRDKEKSPQISRDFLKTRCRVSDTVLRARLSDLRKQGFIMTEKDGERLTTAGLLRFRDFLREMRSKTNEGDAVNG